MGLHIYSQELKGEKGSLYDPKYVVDIYFKILCGPSLHLCKPALFFRSENCLLDELE